MLPVVSLIVLFLYGYVGAVDLVPAVLVNQMVLQTQRYGDFEYTVYHYGDGDVVDASCVSLSIHNHCFVQLKYDYAASLDDLFKSYNLGSYLGVGFHAKLKAIHNNSRLICKCAGFKLQTITTFILQDKFNDILKVNINGLTLRDISKNNKDVDIRVQKDEHIGNEDINVQLSTVLDDVALNWYPPPNKDLNILKNNNRIIHFTIPSGKFTLIVTLAHNRTKFLIRTLKINLTPLPFASTEYKRIIRDLPKENALLELFNYEGKQQIYYEYEEDDILNLQCVTTSSLRGLMRVTGLENVEDSFYGNITKKLQLSSKENNTVPQCILESQGFVVGRAFIYLRYKSPVLRILVNRLRLTTHRNPDDNINRSAVYHYESGDLVDLSCMKLADSCTMMLNFSHADTLDDIFESTDLMSPTTIGFRATLDGSDDKRHIVCKCICPNNTTTFRVTFVLQNKFDDPVHNEIKLVINNRTVREIIPKQEYPIQSSKFVLLTYYSGYESFNIKAHTQRYDTMLYWDFKGPEEVIKNHSKDNRNSSISIELDMNQTYNESVDLHIYVYDGQLQLMMITITFVILSRYSIITLVNKGEDNRLSYFMWFILIVPVIAFITGIIYYLRRKKAFTDSAEYTASNEFEIDLKSTTSKNLPSAPPYESYMNISRSGSKVTYVNHKNKKARTVCDERDEHVYEDIDN